MYGNRLVIPDTLHREMLKKIHDDGHLSLVKCRQRVAGSVWWPGINGQLKMWINRCGFCQENRMRQHAEPLQPTELANGPWSQVGVDFADYEGRQYLIVVDYFSRWLEALPMSSTSSTSTINRLRGLFARFGIPEILRTDGGPQFTSHAFAEFSKAYDFKHIMSSPHNPRSNGAVERAVQTAKRLIKQPDPTLAILAYRNTPLEVTGQSPARLLMGRSLRTRLPVHPSSLTPRWPDFVTLREHHDQKKEKQKEGYDRRNGAVLIEPPAVGDEVRVRHDGERQWHGPVHILGPALQPNSFIVPSPITQAPVIRNRRFILPIPPDSRPTPDTALPPVFRPTAAHVPAPQAPRSITPPCAPSPSAPPQGEPLPMPSPLQGSPPTAPPPAASPQTSAPPPAAALRPAAAPPPERPQATAAPSESAPQFTRSGRRVRSTKCSDYHYY